jgi:hypothetical protein
VSSFIITHSDSMSLLRATQTLAHRVATRGARQLSTVEKISDNFTFEVTSDGIALITLVFFWCAQHSASTQQVPFTLMHNAGTLLVLLNWSW